MALDYPLLSRTASTRDGTKCEKVRVFKRYATGASNASRGQQRDCGDHVHPTAGGTISHKSSTSLHLWFYAMYLMVSTRCGISAKELERELGVTYKTAWSMFHLIRNELMVQDDETMLDRDVEMDETSVEGRPCVRLLAGFEHLGLVAAVERGGRIDVPATSSGSG